MDWRDKLEQEGLAQADRVAAELYPELYQQPLTADQWEDRKRLSQWKQFREQVRKRRQGL
jgi:hypothetical protein